jgi:hypothetical protein
MAGLIPGPTSFNGSPHNQQLALYSDVYLGTQLRADGRCLFRFFGVRNGWS